MRSLQNLSLHQSSSPCSSLHKSPSPNLIPLLLLFLATATPQHLHKPRSARYSTGINGGAQIGIETCFSPLWRLPDQSCSEAKFRVGEDEGGVAALGFIMKGRARVFLWVW
uniref:Uncharacterized protein n=1 Tax=Lotus japonicus TaxID=34305 RepID=I3SRR6_LOTJA|nr:unknown [Lotus japonicus]